MQVQVALSKDFLKAMSRLPKAQQKKVREFASKFANDPDSPGINYETIADAADSNMRSVRIDQTYRAIVIRPPKGNVYVLAWVDHHDDAYDWAQRRQVAVNPRSGILQVWQTQEVDAPEAAPDVVTQEEARLFSEQDDEALLLAGVPMPLLAAVRAVASEQELDDLSPHLPEDASEILYYLAAGFDLFDALEEAARAKPTETPQEVDPEDFGAALEKPESQRQFQVFEDPEDLDAVLAAPLAVWRTFLHPTQRQLVEMGSGGPARVLGGAGTGKTVVLMHRARHLAQNIFASETDRLLVTTYTSNLATDLEANLKTICGPEMHRIEVSHLHSWAARFLRSEGHTFKVATEDSERRKMMEGAASELGQELGFSPSFLMDEWAQVCQGQDVESRDDYLGARRTGRGVRLSRRQRAGVWKVLQRYREMLAENGLVEWDDVLRKARELLAEGKSAGFSAVLADEVQDLTPCGLKLLRALAPEGANTLFLVGDGHQRIYGAPVSLSSCGINIRGRRSRRLKLNYRTTSRIRRQAIAVLEGLAIDDLDDGLDSMAGYHSLRRGVQPKVKHFDTDVEEGKAIVQQIKGWLGEGIEESSICLTARTGSLISDRYIPLLEREGFECVYLKRQDEDEQAKPGIRVATMHRLKGLEFPKMILASIQEGRVPLELDSIGEGQLEEEHLLRERCLFYVAATRARDDLAIFGYGTKSPFLSQTD